MGLVYSTASTPLFSSRMVAFLDLGWAVECIDSTLCLFVFQTEVFSFGTQKNSIPRNTGVYN